jgi:hypothetical protein
MNPELQKQVDQLFDYKPIRHLDAAFPGFNFMVITHKVEGNKRLVVSTRTIGQKPIYEERELTDTSDLDTEAVLAHDVLVRKAAEARILSDGSVIEAYHSPQQWETLKESETKTPSKRARRRGKRK